MAEIRNLRQPTQSTPQPATLPQNPTTTPAPTQQTTAPLASTLPPATKKLSKAEQSAINKQKWWDLNKSGSARVPQIKQQIAEVIVKQNDPAFIDKPPIAHAKPKIEAYKQARADVLADIQLSIVDALNMQDLAKCPAKDLAILYKTVYDAERLERGQSTSNVDVLAHAAESIARRRLGDTGLSADIIEATVVSQPDPATPQ